MFMGQAEEESVGGPMMKTFTAHSTESRAGLFAGRATDVDEPRLRDSSRQ